MSKRSAAQQIGKQHQWALVAAGALAAATLFTPPRSALGAAKTWDGGGDPTFTWTTGANWDLDTAPVPVADNLIFGGTLGLSNTNDFAANSQFNGITFNNTAGAFTLGGNAINLGGDVVSTGPNLQTIDLALALTAGRVVNTAAGSGVRVNGVISGAFDLSKRGNGTLTLAGANTYTGRTSISAFPNGLMTTPDTHHGGGKLILDFSAAGAPVSNILYNGVALTATQELRVTSGSLEIIGKDATANSQSVGALGLTTGFGNIKLNAGAAGRLQLTKQNSNTLTLTNANTHSGDTLVSSGNLLLGNALALQQSTINQQGSGVVVFDAAAGPAFTVGGLKNNLATHTIALQDNAPTPGAITLSLGNNNQSTSYSGAITGPGSLTKVGTGTLTASQVKVGGAVTLSTGNLTIAPDGTAAGMLETTSLTFADGTILAMNDNDFIVNYGVSDPSPEFALRDKVKAFADNPAATSGISFTPGAGDVTIAVAEKTEWGFGTFNGVPLDDTTVIGKYTYYGDSNLDGAVTSDDYVAVDVGLGTGDSWVQGDFNFSGSVTSDDYVAIDVNLGKGTPTPLAWAELKSEMVALHTAMFGDEYVQKLALAEAEGYGALVPEPGALSLVGLAAAGLLGRRRRRA